MGNLSVTEHINGEMREFALYTIYSRALPSMIDGFKPSQRKAIYTATKMAKTKQVKTLALVGGTYSVAFYHHGDMSMSECIVKLAAPHANNMPILDGEGTFGSRLVPTAASPRYTAVKLSSQFDKFFPDNEICPVNPDNEHPEPVTYLPIIPWVLINGIKGIATGFACSILPRSVENISSMCIDYLLHKPLNTTVKPSFPFFNGKVSSDGESWIVKGIGTRISPTIFDITELPVGYDREKYIVVLDKLEDAGIILSYSDECSKKGFRFKIKLPRSSKNLTDEQLIVKLKLTKRYTENLTTINQHGELVIHNTVADLVKDFCDYRLEKYNDRYAYRIARDTNKREELRQRMRFCKSVVSGMISFQGKTKFVLQTQLTKMKFTKEHQNKFLDLPIHAMTLDNLNKMDKEVAELDKNINLWQTIDIRKQYLKELRGL